MFLNYEAPLRCLTSEMLLSIMTAIRLLVIKINCEMCGKELKNDEVILCASCIAFLEWKYGSLENFEKIRNKSSGGGTTNE